MAKSKSTPPAADQQGASLADWLVLICKPARPNDVSMNTRYLIKGVWAIDAEEAANQALEAEPGFVLVETLWNDPDQVNHKKLRDKAATVGKQIAAGPGARITRA